MASHSLWIKTDGTLWGLGYNANGQLGTGDTTVRNTAVQIDTNVKTVSSGYFHSVYLKNDHTLWGTGSNGGGQLGDGTLTSRSTPYQMTTNVAAVSAGENNTLFTKYDGTLWATGYTANGQFGNGTTATVTTPVQLGSGVVLAPPPPADLTATSNDPYDRVLLTWSPDVNATSYEVWRSPTNDGASAILLTSGLRWSFFEDLTASLGQTYYYAVKASNPTGSSEFGDPTNVHTGAAIPLTITSHPQDASITVGQDHTFTVVATGTGTLTYQWRKNGTSITGATTASYTISNASLGDAGSYEVVVTDDGGPTTSDEADLSVTTATATVTLGNLNAIYDGNPHAATATTDPSGLTVTFTYNGSPTEPTDAGDYTVIGTIDDASYEGSATDTLMISKAGQTISFAALSDRGFTNSPITLSAVSDSGLPVSFAVQSGPASVGGDQLTLTGTGTVIVRASQAGNSNYLAAAHVDRAFEVTVSALSWLDSHFTESEINDELISGSNADPDGDGMTNLLEYALGLDPRSPETTGLPEMSTTATDWVYTYTRPVDRSDITYEVEISSDLSSWSTTSVTHELLSNDGDTQTWRATVPLIAGESLYFHLKISQY